MLRARRDGASIGCNTLVVIKRGTDRWHDRAKATTRHAEMMGRRWLARAEAKAGSTHNAGHAASSHDVVTSIASVAEAASIAFHRQGDERFLTLRSFMQRQRLRRHPLVLAALSRWWDVALLTARRRRSTARGLSFRDYVNVYLLLSAELLPPEEHDPAECEAEAREEWERDSAGGGGGESSTMQRIQFLDSVFELSDLYTTSAAPSAYARFLTSLLAKCVDPATGRFRDAVVTGGSASSTPPEEEEEEDAGDEDAGNEPGRHGRSSDLEPRPSCVPSLPEIGETPQTRQALMSLGGAASASKVKLAGAGAPNATRATGPDERGRPRAAAAPRATTMRGVPASVPARVPARTGAGLALRLAGVEHAHEHSGPARGVGPAPWHSRREASVTSAGKGASAGGTSAGWVLHLAGSSSAPLLPLLQPALPVPRLRPSAFDEASSYARARTGDGPSAHAHLPDAGAPALGSLARVTSLPARLRAPTPIWQDTLRGVRCRGAGL